MHRPIKYVEKALTVAADKAFDAVQFFNKYRPNPSFTPKWSDKPLQKSWQKSKPPLGWPRTTDSLCPKCVIEARKRILDGEVDYRILIDTKVGEIKATILERDGRIPRTRSGCSTNWAPRPRCPRIATPTAGRRSRKSWRCSTRWWPRTPR